MIRIFVVFLIVFVAPQSSVLAQNLVKLDVNYSNAYHTGSDVNPIVRTPNPASMSFYHVDFNYAAADGQTSGAIPAENAALVVTNSYGQMNIPNIPAAKATFQIQSNCDKNFLIIDRSFYSWLGSFTQQKGITNTSPNEVKIWYDQASAADKTLLDNKVKEYGVDNYEILFNNCPSYIRNSTRHDPWSIVKSYFQPHNQNDPVVVGAWQLPDNAGRAFKGIGYMKQVTLVQIHSASGVKDTTYASKKYFKCFTTIVETWPSPTLTTNIQAAGNVVKLQDTLSYTPVADASQFGFRIISTSDTLYLQKSVPYFQFSELNNENISPDNDYFVSAASEINGVWSPYGKVDTLQLVGEGYLISDSKNDFSTEYQGKNGFMYGFYSGDVETGSFSTENFTVQGNRWKGIGYEQVGQTFMHPGEKISAVRRYTVGSDNEPNYTGPVVLSGKFWDMQAGSEGSGAVGFVTVNGKVVFSEPVVQGSTEDSAYNAFNITVEVDSGSTIDFGVRKNGSSAYDGTGNSVVILKGDNLVPQAPVLQEAVSNAANQITLHWQDNSDNEEGFVVERSLNNEKNYTVIATLPANTVQFIDINLPDYVTYFYRIKATKGDYYSSASNSIVTSVKSSLSFSDSVLADSKGDFSVDYQGKAGFSYGYYTGDVETGTFSTELFTVQGNRWKTTSYEQVGQAFMHPGEKITAVRRYTVGSDNEPAYEGLVVLLGKFWDMQTGSAGSGAVGFVTVDGKVVFSEPVIQGSTEDSAYNAFNITIEVDSGSTIDFGVRKNGSSAYDGTGNSVVILKGDNLVPQAPVLQEAVANTANQIALNWQDNSDNEEGFVVERSLNNETNYAVIATLPANTTQFIDTNLPEYATYFYRIKATKGDYYSSASNSIVTSVKSSLSFSDSVLADSKGDFSVAYQGKNGFSYGYYTGDVETGTFSTELFTVQGNRWKTTSYEQVGQTFMHPGEKISAVRRYTVGADNEPNYTGPVVLSGKFWDMQVGSEGSGAVGFVTVNGKVVFSEPVFQGSTEDSAYNAFNITVEVDSGSTIDFGVRKNGSASYDGTGNSVLILKKLNNTFYAIQSGDWHDPAIWSRFPNGSPANAVPGVEDDVFINGHEVTVSQSQQCKNIAVGDQQSAAPSALHVIAGELEVDGKITLKKSNTLANNPKMNVQEEGKLVVRAR